MSSSAGSNSWFSSRRYHCLVMLGVLAIFLWESGRSQERDALRWEIKTLTVDSNEGIDVADFDGDGLLDVVAGRNWYAAPDFVPRPVRTLEDWNGWVESNGDFAFDVNADGRMDVIAGAFHLPEVHWYENPGQPNLKQGKIWKRHLLMDTGAEQNEGQLLHDMDLDGIPEWVVNSWSEDTPLVAWRFVGRSRSSVIASPGRDTMPEMERFIIGGEVNGHGLGFGDLNGDGRQDVLFKSGWYEAPRGNLLSRPWQLHRDWTVHASVPMLVRDLNKDGRADVILGLGHDYGLFWWEQQPPSPDGGLVWFQHRIDDSFSQPHCLHLADLDGDGVEELITGKRVFAHNGNDPGGNEPPCLYYYKWNPDRLNFDRYTINEGRVGTGLQIRTADLDADGVLDIAVAGKSGTYLLFNRGR